MRWMLLVAVVVSGCSAQVPSAELELDAWSKMPAQHWTMDPSERAIEIWTSEHGTPSEKCAEDTRAATITAKDFRDVATVCVVETAGTVAGCMYRYDIHGVDIVVDDAQDSHDLRTHELLHALYECTNHRPAIQHNDVVWTHVPVAW